MPNVGKACKYLCFYNILMIDILFFYIGHTQVYIYSSGSREAQRLIFGYTRYGDLRPYLCGYFDTVTG